MAIRITPDHLDPQRELCYAFERKWLQTTPAVARIEHYNTMVIMFDTLSAYYGIPRITVEIGNNRKTGRQNERAVALSGSNKVIMPAWTWSPTFVLHEFAHILNYRMHDVGLECRGHTDFFMALLLALHTAHLGMNGPGLAVEARRNGLKVAPLKLVWQLMHSRNDCTKYMKKRQELTRAYVGLHRLNELPIPWHSFDKLVSMEIPVKRVVNY